jgi:hypothetical protein
MGTFSTADVPGARQTWLNRISNNGNIVGCLQDAKNEGHGIIDHEISIDDLHNIIAVDRRAAPGEYHSEKTASALC